MIVLNKLVYISEHIWPDMFEDVNRNTASAFLTQTLPSSRLEITNRLFIVGFSIFSLVFSIFGVVLIFSHEPDSQFCVDYTDECPAGDTCTLRVNITGELAHPIAVMYRISGLYQNHLKSMTSRNDNQLRGEYVRYDQMEACSPYRSWGDDPSPTMWILPCGLEAVTMFNDTFEIDQFRLHGPDYQETGVVMRELNAMYQTGDKWLEEKEEYTNDQLNLRFASWMDTAAFPKFQRIWGKTLESGAVGTKHLDITIQSNYNASAFGGRKEVIIAGKRSFPKGARLLGTFYIGFGVIMFISAASVVVAKQSKTAIA